MTDFKTEIRDGMAIDWDVAIEMDDGLVLRCDVYRPIEDGKYPVLLTYRPYGKYLHFEDGYKARPLCSRRLFIATRLEPFLRVLISPRWHALVVPKALG